MCVSVVGGGNFFWSNFGGDRRVWLSVGGWCVWACWREGQKDREEREMKKKKEN